MKIVTIWYQLLTVYMLHCRHGTSQLRDTKALEESPMDEILSHMGEGGQQVASILQEGLQLEVQTVQDATEDPDLPVARKPFNLIEYAILPNSSDQLNFGEPNNTRTFGHAEGNCSADTWSLVQRWESMANQFSDVLMWNDSSDQVSPAKEFVTAFYLQLELLRSDQISLTTALLSMLTYPDSERIKKFGLALFIPAVTMPVFGMTLMLCRMKLGWCGASYQPFNVLLYRVLWRLLSLLLFLAIFVLIASTALAFIAAFGLVHGLRNFEKTTEQLFEDVEVAAWNIRQQLLHLRESVMIQVVDTMLSHFEWVDELISNSVWQGLPQFVQSGIDTLGILRNESAEIRDYLYNLNDRLRNVTATVSLAGRFLRVQRDALNYFKGTCSTPYFCGRMDATGLDVNLDTTSLDVNQAVNETSAIIFSGFPALVGAAIERFNRTGHTLLSKTADIFQECMRRVSEMKTGVLRVIDPLLNVNKPTLDEVARSRENFRQLPSKIGGTSLFDIEYGFFGLIFGLAVMVCWWIVANACGICCYEPIVLPATRSLRSDCAGIVLMGVTYCSTILACIVLIVGISVVMCGSFARAVICPLLETAVYPYRETDQLITGLLADNNLISSTTHLPNSSAFESFPAASGTGISIGIILEECAKNLGLLEVFSLRSHDGSHFPHQEHGLNSHTSDVVVAIENSHLQEILQEVIHRLNGTEARSPATTTRSTLATSSSDPEDMAFTALTIKSPAPKESDHVPTPQFKYFPDELLNLLAKYQSNLTHFTLQSQKTQLSKSVTKVPVQEFMHELQKIKNGLVSKPPEQEAIDGVLSALQREFQSKLLPAHRFQMETLHDIEEFERNMTRYERTPKRFSENKLAIENYAKNNMYQLVESRIMAFITRLTGYKNQLKDNILTKTFSNRTGECDAIKKAAGQFSRLVCHCILGNMLLLGMSLIAAALTLAPACLLGVLLGRQLIILPQSDHVDDYFERGIPAEYRKWPVRKTFV